MAISRKHCQEIETYLIAKFNTKLLNYHPETQGMPFQYRLLGKDKMALFSFIQSINTMLGQSVFEHIGKIVASERALEATEQYKNFSGYVSDKATLAIDKIMRDLAEGSRKPNKQDEIPELLSVATRGELGKKIKERIDLFIRMKDGNKEIEYYFEIKTAKPNMATFNSVKRQLLNWTAMHASSNSYRKNTIKTILAIPYNPYEPKPYRRYNSDRLFAKEEILVAEEFWDLLGGKGAYAQLLRVFETVGLELSDKIDKKMQELNN